MCIRGYMDSRGFFVGWVGGERKSLRTPPKGRRTDGAQGAEKDPGGRLPLAPPRKSDEALCKDKVSSTLSSGQPPGRRNSKSTHC